MGVIKVADMMTKFLNKQLTKIKVPIHTIIIEAQPKKRLIMERILCYTVCYLRTNYSNAKIYIKRSQDKFSINNIKCPKNYTERKRMAVEIGYKCLSDKRNIHNHDPIIKWLDKFNKKDDLFDAFLLILKFVNYTIA
jgi:hypothetical protein